MYFISMAKKILYILLLSLCAVSIIAQTEIKNKISFCIISDDFDVDSCVFIVKANSKFATADKLKVEVNDIDGLYQHKSLAKKVTISTTSKILNDIKYSYLVIQDKRDNKVSVNYLESTYKKDNKILYLTKTKEYSSDHKANRLAFTQILPDTLSTPITQSSLDTLTPGDYFTKMQVSNTISADSAKNWLWISVPFNSTISIIQHNGDTLYQCPQNADKACFIVSYYDPEARAQLGKEHASAEKPVFIDLTSDTLLAGRGYILGIDDRAHFPVTVTYSSLDSSVYTIPQSYDFQFTPTASPSGAAYDDWHLVGSGLFHQANTVATSDGSMLYLGIPRLTGGYDVMECSPGQALPSDIQSFVCFFIQRHQPYSLLYQTPAAAEYSHLQSLDAFNSLQRFSLHLSTPSNTDIATHFRFDSIHTPYYESGFDFLCLNSGSGVDCIHSYQDSTPLSYNWLPIENQIVPIGVDCNQTTQATFSLADYNAHFEKIILHDQLQNVDIDLLSSDYTTQLDVGTNQNRFSLFISTTTDTTVDIKPSYTPTFRVVSSTGHLDIIECSPDKMLTVTDILGRIYYHQQPKTNTLSINALPRGVYLITHGGTTIRSIIK